MRIGCLKDQQELGFSCIKDINSAEQLLSSKMYKYPYCGKLYDTKDYLSDKVCRGTIKIRKKIVRKTKRIYVYGKLILSLGNRLSPAPAIALPILLNPLTIMKFSHSNVDLSKKAIIAQVIKEMPAEIDFTEREIDQLYNLEIEWRNNSLSQEELITKISNLRGGSFINVVAALRVIGAMIILLTNGSLAFKPNPNEIIPPHLQWLYENQKPGNYFEYGKEVGPRSITVTILTQNVGSEKNDPSSGSYNYIDVMRKLYKQSSKKIVEIEVGS
mmetsp:Transcript_4633/g.8591  ORF Transcript_4633/g.8591 Transcript_4633/m.8591 type:complete len:272 (-) Transcript_4633:463-1278(-)